ncbi:hypothetical protein [Mycobacterium servetii]|uniref:Transcription factor NusA first KH domain-containing protein n=1 Tax=Mycobacterium servetii TaxID=3237418 RepID=A0ABV4C943_9MYCO
MTALNEVCGPILRRPDSGDSDRDLFEDLFARRIHDVANGSIRVVSAVRRPGRGSVVAVQSAAAGVDAAAACIGSGGCRVRDIEAWFPGEHITIVSSDPPSPPVTATGAAYQRVRGESAALVSRHSHIEE